MLQINGRANIQIGVWRRPIKQRENMDPRSGKIVAAVVEQSYKDLTPPAEDKNPLTDMSSHLCTCVLNTSYSWSGPRTTRRIHIRKGETKGNPHGIGGSR